jgi:ferredoxin
MATLQTRNAGNTAGKYYVDDSCIDCDVCRTEAPEFFRRDDDLGFSVVIKQPVTPEEIAAVEAVLSGCPTESIGSDGV